MRPQLPLLQFEQAVRARHDDALRLAPVEPARLVDVVAQDADGAQSLGEVADPVAVWRPRLVAILRFVPIDRVLGEHIKPGDDKAPFDLAPARRRPFPPTVAPIVQNQRARVHACRATNSRAVCMGLPGGGKVSDAASSASRPSAPLPAFS